MFRFTIREIVLLTLIVALALGWWLDHRQMAAPLAEYRTRDKWAQEMAEQQRAMDEAKSALELATRDIRWERIKAESVQLGAPVPRSSP